LTLVYFCQVYPYIHLHHSHDDDILPFELSVHPNDIAYNHLPDHNEDNDHHHTFNERVDWHFVRNHSQSIITLAKLFYLPHRCIDDPNENYLTSRVETDRPIEWQFILFNPPEPRGPPISA